MDYSQNRHIRVFVSSTFRDMMEERDELMRWTWPELRRLCRERSVEFIEVDLRWGIAEEQSTRKGILKLCLDEIRACRPFFIGLLGERYGWTPGDDAFTVDLQEEQPWLKDVFGKSVTELEILHGVLNNPEMAGRAFFYFRDPTYASFRGAEFLSESSSSAKKQSALKALVRRTCADKDIPLHDPYPDPRSLANLVLEDLWTAIQAQFPAVDLPDPLSREALDHEAFAETRRRTYIDRQDYYDTIDRHALGDKGPLALLGGSGSGKSALIANWINHWRADHPNDFIFQHYIGGTADSADHWKLMSRLIAEIKRWCNDPEELPRSRDRILKTFPLWIAKACAKARRDGVRCILALDALNQIENTDHARALRWLPQNSFEGPVRLIVSGLQGDMAQAVEERDWATLHLEPLTSNERRRMIVNYLWRFGKALENPRLDRLCAAPAASNPLYLKILLDELRVTGTHDRLDERLTEYLSAPDIPALLRMVLTRYRRDYERERPCLVAEALGFIWSARRGLTEAELLQLLRPTNLPQLPLALWSPLRAALDESLINRAGVLNFAHDFLRSAVEAEFVPDQRHRDVFRFHLADEFQAQPITARSCDELPWLLWQTRSRDRLRECLLNINCFLEIRKRDQEELTRYWVFLGEERAMGRAYLASFEKWSEGSDEENAVFASAADDLAFFLQAAALYAEAETLYRRALRIYEVSYGSGHPKVAFTLNNLAELLRTTNRLAEAESLFQRALNIKEASYAPDHSSVATSLDSLATLFMDTNRLAEAEPLLRRALKIREVALGPDHPNVARDLNNLADLLRDTNRLAEAEPLMRRALRIFDASCGPDHPKVAAALNSLAGLLKATNRPAEAEPLYRRALEIYEASYGPNHPAVAAILNGLAALLYAINRFAEAEPLFRRSLRIYETSLGPNHPYVASNLNNLAVLLRAMNRFEETEALLRRALKINEASYGPDHPSVATPLNSLAAQLYITGRPGEAEPLFRHALKISEASYGPNHPNVATCCNNLALMFKATNRLAEAEPLLRRALSINEASYGPDHPDVATCCINLALLFQATNRLAEAEPLLRRALEITEASYGVDHSETVNLRNNLATLLQSPDFLKDTAIRRRRWQKFWE